MTRSYTRMAALTVKFRTDFVADSRALGTRWETRCPTRILHKQLHGPQPLAVGTIRSLHRSPGGSDKLFCGEIRDLGRFNTT